MKMLDGLIWHSTPRATVGLVVSGGVVIDTPPYARKWALGRPAAELLSDPRADTAWVPNENEDQMTDVMPETVAPDAEAEGWGDDSTVTYPEAPDNPHNHRFTISFDGRGPMVVVRGNTAEDVIAAYQELENHAVGAAMGNAWAALKASAAIANGLGATPVPAGAPALPQAPGVPAPPALPQAPQAQYPAGPPALPQGQAPAAWQNAGAPQQQQPSQEYRQAGWYRLMVPFPKKSEFDGICAQYQLRKGRPTEPGGQYSFQKADKSWYVAPDVAGCFPMFNPMPA